MKSVTIYTDGSAWPNPGPGGWGAVLVFDSVPNPTRIELHGVSGGRTTNNRMEITAAIEGLDFLREPHRVKIVTDSRYLQGGAGRCAYCISDRAKGRYVKPEPWSLNRDLWYRLMEAMKPHQICVQWVKAHANCAENNRADVLAGRR